MPECHLKFLRIFFAKIFATQDTLPGDNNTGGKFTAIGNDTPGHICPQICTDDSDTGGNFATGVNNAGGNWPPGVHVAGCGNFSANVNDTGVDSDNIIKLSTP
jgi:hypothetical protein